ncbi:MAG: trypsin-like peptidase domain-containing protein [Deltaproteobacteria bacterium]|nr:trypsin-like peptidase domain-containing protein [Deltaproteobacteria bacterium]
MVLLVASRTASGGAACALSLLLCVPSASAGPAERRSPVVVATEKAKAAVVNISTETLVQRRAATDLDRFFHQFFGAPQERRLVPNSLGSGVVIDPRGYVVTNYHVIARGSRIKVSFADGRDLLAKVVGTDPRSDLAVLLVKSDTPLPALALAGGEAMIGETSIAIGNPYGLSHTVTSGVISALHRQIKTESVTFFDFIQTDAAINPGNSGGPLLNVDAEIIGINSAIYGGDAQGIGFAIPAERVRAIAGSLIKFGEVREAWIGLSVEDLAEGEKTRVVVSDVEPAGPAAAAGIVAGQIITAVNGAPLQDADEFHYRMHGTALGQPVQLELLRPDGGKGAVAVTPEEFPLKLAESLVRRRIGLELGEARVQVRSSPEPVTVLEVKSVRRASPAARVGLARGDLVRAVNSVEVEGLEQFRLAVQRAHPSGRLVLLVQRGYALNQIEFSL